MVIDNISFSQLYVEHVLNYKVNHVLSDKEDINNFYKMKLLQTLSDLTHKNKPSIKQFL